MLRLGLILMLVCGLWPSTGHSQTMSSNWSKMASIDLKAIHDILDHEYSTVVTKNQDDEFILALSLGYQAALKQLKFVTNYLQYRAVLNTFTHGFNDPAIYTQPVEPPKLSWWPGFVVKLLNERWTVVDNAASLAIEWPVTLPAIGMELLSCDGVEVNDWALASMANYAVNWADSSQREKYSSRLFVGEVGLNPFVAKPGQCRFRYQGRTQSLRLNWLQESSQRLGRLQASQSLLSGSGGVSKFDRGYWVGLGKALGGMTRLVAQVETLKLKLRDAPFLVLDARGAQSCDKHYYERIAKAIYGQAYVDQALKLNLQYTPFKINPMAAGFNGQLFLLTDDHCINSCLLMTQLLLNLGAVQLGKITHGMADFEQVQEHLLPSGVSRLSLASRQGTVIAKRFGPFVPHYTYDGNMDDTQALQHWILNLVESDRD